MRRQSIIPGQTRRRRAASRRVASWARILPEIHIRQRVKRTLALLFIPSLGRAVARIHRRVRQIVSAWLIRIFCASSSDKMYIAVYRDTPALMITRIKGAGPHSWHRTAPLSAERRQNDEVTRPRVVH